MHLYPSVSTPKVPSVHVGAHTHVNPNTIVRMVALRNYTQLFFTDRKSFIVSRTLKYLEETLQPYGNFVRINRHESVNELYVKKCLKSGVVILRDESRIVPSRRRAKKTFEYFNGVQRLY
ncbi:LytTR family DNA-binding domain-containing protein [Telluribacter sp. SYSU D00476]|uniref:LytTR family DNA-binding domain-containing protein n=1 Tax=Telluribacter sp. SYSU D00476 TaxID=2811430 RepID=UPI0021D40380|nr:LytTR family DNA-binding domain-containing protein [Telluribacter sp. SYSU D00476]